MKYETIVSKRIHAEVQTYQITTYSNYLSISILLSNLNPRQLWPNRNYLHILQY